MTRNSYSVQDHTKKQNLKKSILHSPKALMNTLHLLEVGEKKIKKRFYRATSVLISLPDWISGAENMTMCRSEIPENLWGKKNRIEKSAKIDFQS